MRLPLFLAGLLAGACASGDNLHTRHGSPLHTYACDGGKTFLSRQIISGEVEITAGGETRDVTNADGDPIAGGPQLIYANETATLTGMPGGPYTGCRLDDADEQ